MSKRLTKDEVNLRLDKLNLKLISNFENTYTKCKVKCYCGNEFICKLNSIFTGRTRSCGCYQKEIISKTCLINLVGQKFGRLEVLELLPLPKKSRKYKCLCKKCHIKFHSKYGQKCTEQNFKEYKFDLSLV